MQPLPKYPNPTKRRRNSQEWLEYFNREAEFWKGREHTKAYRFRHSHDRDMAREFGRNR